MSGDPVTDREHQVGHPVPLDADRRIAERDILQRHLAEVRATLPHHHRHQIHCDLVKQPERRPTQRRDPDLLVDLMLETVA